MIKVTSQGWWLTTNHVPLACPIGRMVRLIALKAWGRHCPPITERRARAALAQLIAEPAAPIPCNEPWTPGPAEPAPAPYEACI